MNTEVALGLVSDLLKLAFVISAPLLVTILVVGLAISVLQVVTQIQDPSIAFVPKLAVFAIVLTLLAPWMLSRLVGFGTAMFVRIAH
jgi:flagellar biosynthetic protein FliQ